MELEVAKFLIVLLCGVLLLTFIILPIIRRLFLKYTSPEYLNQKSSNSELFSFFGGVAFFISLLISIIISCVYFNAVCESTLIMVSSMTITFLIGFKDDLKGFPAISNCLGQLFASCILISITDFGISNLHGFFGINSLPITLSIVLSIFLIISMGSAFDIIAGIASITGISIAALKNTIGIELMPFSTDESLHSLDCTS
jgi:UDP-GlcNAc:undecaprenyl-phosphate GlcNAc-1-phosphate transferase